MSIFDTLVASAISGGFVAAGFTWMAKTWLSERLKQSIQHEYATLLEAHKATLKAEMDLKLAEAQATLTSKNAVAIEQFKSDLQVAASERQLRYKHVYDRETEAIAETYENLRAFVSAVETYVSVGNVTTTQSSKEFFLAANSGAVKFFARFTLHRLYLPLTLADFVEGFARELLRKVQHFQVLVDMNEDKGRSATCESSVISEYMNKEVPSLLGDLELEFRRRLGQQVDRSP